jgi:hypothetical protein
VLLKNSAADFSLLNSETFDDLFSLKLALLYLLTEDLRPSLSLGLVGCASNNFLMS